MGSEPEEKDDVEGHYLGDAPSSDAPSLDRDTGEGADVEGHYLGDAPSSDAPSLDRDSDEGADVEGHYLGDAPSSDAPSADYLGDAPSSDAPSAPRRQARSAPSADPVRPPPPGAQREGDLGPREEKQKYLVKSHHKNR